MAPAVPAVHPRRLRRPLVAGASVAAVAVLGGCSSFSAPPTAAQLDVIGATRAHVDLCITGFGDSRRTTTAPVVIGRDTPAAPCPEVVNDPSTSEPSGQSLLAVRVPDGTTVPAALHDASGTGADFAVDSDYAAAAEAHQPAEAGTHWVAFRSEPLTVPSDTDGTHPLDLAVDVDLGLPRSAAGSQVELPVLVGDRIVRPTDGTPYTAGRPTDCDEADLSTPDNSTRELPTGCFQADGVPALDVRDLDVTAAAGELPTVVAGATATVPFTATFVGTPDDGTSFALAATTAVPGASATPASASFAPTDDAATPLSVAVAVPAGAAPGRYAVELTATTGAEVRRATRTIEVVAPPVPTPQPDPAPTTSTEQAPPAPAPEPAPAAEPAPTATTPATTTTVATTPQAVASVPSVPPAASAPAPAAPARAVAAAPLRLTAAALDRPGSPAALLARGLDVPLSCDARCTVVVDLVVRRPTRAHPRHVVLLARRSVTLAAGDEGEVHLAVLPSARGTLRRGPATIAVIATARPVAGGAPTTQRRKLRLGDG